MDPAAAFGPLELGTAGVSVAIAWRLLGILEGVVRERLKPTVPPNETALAEIHKVTTARDSQDRYLLWAPARLTDAIEANTKSQETGIKALGATTIALNSQTCSMAELIVELRRNLDRSQS